MWAALSKPWQPEARYPHPLMMDGPEQSPASKSASFDSTLLHPGQRILARNEIWRMRSGQSISERACLLELEAVEGKRRRSLTRCVPPDDIVPLFGEAPAFDRSGVESFSIWACLHGVPASTLVRGTDLLFEHILSTIPGFTRKRPELVAYFRERLVEWRSEYAGTTEETNQRLRVAERT